MLIYIPYESYHQSVKVLDDARLLNQAAVILDTLNLLSNVNITDTGFTVVQTMYGWNHSTRCDLAAFGLYTCGELRYRHLMSAYDERMRAAWVRLRRPGKLRQRVQRTEEFHLSVRQLLVWEDPDHYEGVFNMSYIPFKPVIPWY